MMPKYLLLLFIPAIYGRIVIKIRAANSEDATTVKFSGDNTAIITDQERETFNIGDDNLKHACDRYSGKRPTDVFVRRPTPWADVYRKFHWPQVQRVFKPVAARVVGLRTTPVIVSTREFENYSHSPTKFNGAISHSIEETVTNTWQVGGELSVGQAISYNLNFAAGSIGGTTSVSYTASFGNETSKAKTVTLGSTTGLETEVAPGKAVVATLSATHGTLEIEIDYEAFLIGRVFANYHNKFNKHNWWGYSVSQVMLSAGIPNSIMSTEKISIGFYTTASVVVRDKETNVDMKSHKARITHQGKLMSVL